MPPSTTIDEAVAPTGISLSAQRAIQDGAGPTPDNLTELWAQHFRQKEAERGAPVRLHPLPSGGPPIMAVRLPLKVLIRKGMVPDRLTAVVDRWIGIYDALDPKKAQQQVADDFEEDPEGSFIKWSEMLNYVWMTSVVVPKYTNDLSKVDYEAGIFDVSEVDFSDKLYLYAWCQGVDETVEEFFRKQIDPLEPVPDGRDVQDDPGGVVRIPRPGGRLAGVSDQPGDASVGDVGQGPNRGNRRKAGQAKTQKRAANRNAPPVQRAADSGVPDGAAAGAGGRAKRAGAGDDAAGDQGGELRPVRGVRRRRTVAPGTE
jgi:hypothetical protein